MNYKGVKPTSRRLISKNSKCSLCGSAKHNLIHEFDHPVTCKLYNQLMVWAKIQQPNK